jgi:hypothetical protein
VNAYEIRNIDRESAKKFIFEYHYLKNKPFRSSFIYGLITNTNDLKGVCVFHGLSVPETAVGAFGLSRTHQDGLFELGRLAMHPSLNGGNYTSWFVSRAVKQLQKDIKVRAIISYADSSAGHLGSIYRACNALYCGMTEPKNDYYINGKIKERGVVSGLGEWKPRPQKHRYVWMFDPTLHLKWGVVSCNKDGLPKWLSKQLDT